LVTVTVTAVELVTRWRRRSTTPLAVCRLAVGVADAGDGGGVRPYMVTL